MTDQSYAREKLGIAVTILATGSSSLKDRIYDAFLSLGRLRPNDFKSDEDADRYLKLADQLTSETGGDPDKGRIKNTLDVMDEDTARAIAEEIVALNHSVRSQRDC